MSPQPSVADILLLRERQRQQYLVGDQFAHLHELLSQQLVHTHARGRIDNRDSYIGYLKETIQFLELERGKLTLTELADGVVLMHGSQTNHVRLRTGSDVVVAESVVSQIWVREKDDQWKLAMFHATPLPS